MDKIILVIMSLLGITIGFSQNHDVGCTKLIIPDTVTPGTNVTPACSVYNFGDSVETYLVRMKIHGGYNETTRVNIHAPGAYSYVTFPSWYAIIGNYSVTCSTELSIDMDKTNDKKTGFIYVELTGNPVWTTLAPIPLYPSRRRPKSGSAIAGLEATGKVYFLKASNTPDFAQFNPGPYPPDPGTWSEIETIPYGTLETFDGKHPKKGAALCALEPKKCLYALRGNNTRGFWKYQADTLPGDTVTIGWKKMKEIPFGATAPKAGTGLVAVVKGDTDYIFAMKGSRTDEFYLYNIETDSWTLIKSPPVGTSGRSGYKNGSCLAYDGNNYVYVLKGYYGDFFKYSIAEDSWIELIRYDPAIFPSREGKKKRIKVGSGLVYKYPYLYLLKGSNTDEIWKYRLDTVPNTWVQPSLGLMWPIPVGGGKKVRGGGCMTNLGDYLYAVKGANTNEFYGKSFPPFSTMLNTVKTEGAVDYKLETAEFKFSIAPNPAKGVMLVRCPLTVSTIKIFDVSGKLIKEVQKSTSAQEQEIRISLKGINPGIYFLQLGSTVRKFLVVR